MSPVPPIQSKDENTRYFHLREDDQFDEAQFKTWVEQASQLPGWGKN